MGSKHEVWHRGMLILLLAACGWLLPLSSRAASQLGGAGGPFGLGRSRAKRYDQTQDGAPRITFDCESTRRNPKDGAVHSGRARLR